ncbi:unnamed protein product [Hymenolepis diminuta]|uniref:Uncharacterized protein n=1 Tax=Hymenolepis diminuta TaxID=6216 RepID=A0A564Y161_HYMDI|nr:unnamed protein product [Hymenolepis diminuta]
MEESQGGTSYCKTLNVKYAGWVDSVLDDVKSNIEHILQIWNSIGFDEKRIERRINILKKELNVCLRSLISEEDKKVASLHKDVEELEAQVINLSNDLGMKVESTDSDLSLLDRQKFLSETREKLSETVSSRMERFKTLSSENQRICEKLGENPRQFSFESVPSNELLKSMDDEINVLLLKLSHKDDTKSDVSNCKNETISPECDSARGDSLITSIRDALIELHELYDECLVDSFARDNFPLDCPLESVSATYLEKINLEIARWKDYRNKFIEAISAYNSWCRSFGRLNEIEDLINQGKGPERLEKEATSLREKILPDLEKLLDLASRRSSKFKIYGQPPTAYVQMIRRSQAKSSVPPKSPKPVILNATARRPDIKKKKLTSSLKKPCSIPKPAWSFRRTRAKSKNLKLNESNAPSSTSSVQSEPITPKTPIPKSDENKPDPKILSLWTRNRGDGSSTTSQRAGSFTSVINKTAPTTPKNRPPLSRMLGKKKATASPAERCRSETRSANKRRISKSFERFKAPQRRKSSAVFSTCSQESSEQSILDLWYKKKDTSSTSQCGSLASVKSEMAPTTLKTRPPISKIFGKKTTTSSVERLHTGTRSSMKRRVSKSSERFKLPQRRKSSTTSSISSQLSYKDAYLWIADAGTQEQRNRLSRVFWIYGIRKRILQALVSADPLLL